MLEIDARGWPYCVFELDDFTTGSKTLRRLESLKRKRPGFKATLFTLLGLSDPHGLERAAALGWVELCLHGWDHFGEWRWGYWEARHLLETADDLGCFTKIFKMPWNRWPRPGFLRALRERDYAFATPYRAQSLLAGAFGLPVYGGYRHSVWLHPPQLDDFVLVANDGLEFFFVSEVMSAQHR